MSSSGRFSLLGRTLLHGVSKYVILFCHAECLCIVLYCTVKGKSEGSVYFITSHEGPDEQFIIALLFL
jgi:hypothetical protein